MEELWLTKKRALLCFVVADVMIWGLDWFHLALLPMSYVCEIDCVLCEILCFVCGCLGAFFLSVLQKMAEERRDSRVKWPFTSVQYLNTATRSHSPLSDMIEPAEASTAQPRPNSPWIGLLPMENSNPSSQETVDMESAVGGMEYVASAESHPGSLPAGVVKPNARHTGEGEARKAQKCDDEQHRQVVATMPIAPMVQHRPSSPEVITLYPREAASVPVQQVAAVVSAPEPVMLPDVSMPPPNYPVPAAGHYVNLNPPGYPAYTVESRRQGVPSSNMHYQGMYASPPPEYGRFSVPRNMGAAQEHYMGAAPPVRHVADQCSQTGSGLKQNYVRPHAGPAGVPDSRIICPNCQCDKWYIDMVTQQNPSAPTLSVMESRMTCLVCNGDVWQVDVLTGTRRTRGTAAQVPPRAMDIEKIVTPSIYSQQGRHRAPGRHMSSTTMAGRSMDSTPESGYSSGATPPSDDTWRVARPRPRNPVPHGIDQRMRPSRVARQLAYEEEGEKEFYH